MKRLLLFALLLLMLTSTAHSEALLVLLFGDRLSTERFQLGINAAVTGSDLMGLDGTKTRYSWAFGMFGDIKVSDAFRIQAELTVKTPAGARNRPDVGLVPNQDDCECIDPDTFTRDTEMNYLTMPVYFKYFIARTISLGLGPQVGYLTSAKDIYEGKTTQDRSMTVVNGATGDYKRWDFGFTAKAEWVFSPHKEMRSLRLSFNYYYGITDIINNNTGDAVYNSIWLLTLNIPVGGKEAAAEEAEG
jgi:hypothetical protein